jgi:tetratricopeptide (TPR) repeat protein
MTFIVASVVRVFGAFVVLTALSAATTHSQDTSSEKSAVVTGVVCDSANRPLENATVFLESDDHAHKFTVQSDSRGQYRLEAVPAGSYELRVSKSGYGVAKNGPFVLHNAESKSVELRLAAESGAATGKDDDSAAVKFSDEIHFNVASVTDPSNLGGHGSDTVLRTKETLAKKTALLNREAAIPAGPNNDAHPAENAANAHVRLAEAAESEGRPLDAVREYQQAAELQPNEAHLFAWGADLLLHRAFEPASEIFTKGHRLYPNSVRMLLGLSVATYDQGRMEEGKKLLLEACDLDPADPGPYLFLGTILETEKITPPGWTERFKRFASAHAEDALAHYYYAVALAKDELGPDNLLTIETELKRAVALDPELGNAYTQLGILCVRQADFPSAISFFQKAIQATPLADEAHYRLAQAYAHMGQTEKASKETALFRQISEQKRNQAERERHKIQQFVYTLRSPNPSAPSPTSDPH